MSNPHPVASAVRKKIFNEFYFNEFYGCLCKLAAKICILITDKLQRYIKIGAFAAAQIAQTICVGWGRQNKTNYNLTSLGG